MDYIEEDEDGSGDEEDVEVQDPIDQWCWLAYAVWSRASSTFVQHVDVAFKSLTMHDVDAIEAVLKCSYPKLANGLNKPSDQYGFVDLPKGTAFQPLGLNDGDDTGFVLSRDCRTRARYNSDITSDRVDVVVPGYGICNAALGDRVNFILDTDAELEIDANYSRQLGYFKVFLDEVESSAALARLLAMIGGRLSDFWYGNTGDGVVTIDLSVIAPACPHLRRLSLSNVDVVVSEYNEALRNWPIEELDLDGAISGFMPCLSDPAHRMARHLARLRLEVPQGWVFSEENEKELQAHNGDFLSIALTKLPSQSKAAMISVTTRASGDVKAVHRLDSNSLALIFAFAATPKRRTVKIIRNSGR